MTRKRIISIDSLKDFLEAIQIAYPYIEIQKDIVHLRKNLDINLNSYYSKEDIRIKSKKY